MSMHMVPLDIIRCFVHQTLPVVLNLDAQKPPLGALLTRPCIQRFGWHCTSGAESHSLICYAIKSNVTLKSNLPLVIFPPFDFFL